MWPAPHLPLLSRLFLLVPGSLPWPGHAGLPQADRVVGGKSQHFLPLLVGHEVPQGRLSLVAHDDCLLIALPCGITWPRKENLDLSRLRQDVLSSSPTSGSAIAGTNGVRHLIHCIGLCYNDCSLPCRTTESIIHSLVRVDSFTIEPHGKRAFPVIFITSSLS